MDFRAYEATPGISVIVLPDAPVFTHIAVSNDFIRTSGMKRQDVIGKGHFEIFPKSPDDPNFSGEQNLKSSFEQIIRTKEPHEIPEQRYDIPNGDGTFSVRYWKIRNAPILDDAGEVLYIVHSAVDITAVVAAEQRERTFRGMEKAYNLFMQAPVIICIVKGPEYTIELANEGMLRIWGRTENVIGRPLREAVPELEHQGFLNLLDEVKRTGESFYAYENPTTLLRNGVEETLYFDFVYQPYYERGNTAATGVIGVAHDVTDKVLARKKVEEVTERLNFRYALFEAQNEATPDGVLIVDAEGRMLLHNKRFAEIWNMPREILDSRDDEALLRHAMTMMSDPEGFISRVTELYRNRQVKSHDIIRFRDGRVIERNGTPIIAENGLYYGWAWYFHDITDRVRQEQIYRNVVEQAADPILILKGEDLVLQMANDAYFAISEQGPDALNQPFLEIMPDDGELGLSRILLDVLHTGSPYYAYERPVVYRRKDGSKKTVYFNLTNQPYQEADGTISGVLVLAKDVTEHVLAKLRLHENEEELKRFQFMVEHAQDSFFLIRKDGTFAYLNKKAIRTLGYREEEMAVLKITDIDTYYDEAMYAEAFDAAQQETHARFETNHRRKDGFVYPVEVNMVGITYNGVPYMFVIAREITERRKYEEALRQGEAHMRLAVDSARLGTFVVDVEKQTIVHSPRAAEILGLDPAKQWPYADFINTIYPDDLPIRSRAHARAMRTGGLFYEVRVVHPDGSLHWVRLNGSLSRQDKVPLLIGTLLDVTEEKRTTELLEQRIEERTRELMQANEQLKQFTYAASHDLQEPLRKISYFVERLISGGSSLSGDEQQRLAGRINYTIGRMRTLIHDLLNYSNASLGTVAFEPVDLNAVVRDVVDDMEATVLQKGAVIQLGALPIVEGDPRQLKQLFQNLVSNALKYHSPEKAPMVEISSRVIRGEEVAAEVPPERKEASFHQVEVRDNGIGFDPEDAGRIFRLFQRLHGRSEYEGTGVGLAIVQKVAENHQGYVFARSSPGEGAAFRLLLPAD